MSIKKRIFSLFSLSLLSVLLLAPIPSFAKSISLYDEPKENAKVIGSIDVTAGVIPIISNKEGTWMKVGDPRNGHVGWIKTSEVGDGTSSSFTYTQRTINDGTGPQSYQMIQYGQPQTHNAGEMNESLKKMQARQKALQQNLQKSIQGMMNEINDIYKQQSSLFGNIPMIMPIIVVPVESTKSVNNPVPTTKKVTDKPNPN